MFKFIYKGKFNCLITKDVFETHVKQLYYDMKKRFKVIWSPKKFIVTMEMDPTKQKGIGGTTNMVYGKETPITYRLNLQLFGFSKSEITFLIIQEMFGNTLTHEMLHFFIPSINNNSCWSEGVTDFMTFWYSDKIDENLTRLTNEYKHITDKQFKLHKYGYLTGFKKMTKLYKEDSSVITDMKRIIKNFNKNDSNKKKKYTREDIIDYNPKFSIFFNGKCNNHYPHKFK